MVQQQQSDATSDDVDDGCTAGDPDGMGSPGQLVPEANRFNLSQCLPTASATNPCVDSWTICCRTAAARASTAA